MPGASIVADQLTGAGAGTASVSRNDLWLDQAITLSCATGGNSQYAWELLDVPPGSAVSLSVTTPTASFTPDVPGTYRLELVTNNGGAGNVQILALRVRYDSTGNLINGGRVLPGYGETSAEDNAGGNTRGWAPLHEYIEEDTRTRLAAVEEAASGLLFRADYATTANITLSGHQTVDGAQRTTGKLILVRAQNDLTQNGVWVYNSGGAWTRASFFNESAEVRAGMVIEVLAGGATLEKTFWYIVTPDPITLDVTEIEFELAFSVSYGSAGQLSTVNAGDAASAGALSLTARADHQHAVATAAPSGGIGASNSEGSSVNLARADHQHQLTGAIVSTAVAVGNDKAVVSNGSGVLQGCTVSDGQVLAHAGGAFLGVAYTAAATTGALAARDGSGGSAFSYLAVGSSPGGTGDIRGPTAFSIYSSADPLITAILNSVTFGSVGRDTNIEALDLSLYSDSSGVTITSTATGELDIQIPNGVFNVNAFSDISLVGGNSSTFGCTVGTLILGAGDNATTATMSAGTAGNAVSVECSSAADTIKSTINGTVTLQLGTSAATFGVASLTWTEGLAPVIQQAQRTGNNAANELIIASQAPSATSSGSNRDAKRIRLQVPAPVGVGSAESYVGIEISGAERAQIGRYSAVFNDGNTGKAVRIGAQYPGGVPGLNYGAIYFGAGAVSPNTSNWGFLGDDNDTYFNAPGASGTLYYMQAGGVILTLSYASSTAKLQWTTLLQITSAAADAKITAQEGQALTVEVGTRTGAGAPKDITLSPGKPFGSGTGSDRKPGDLNFTLGAPTNGGTDYSVIRTTRGTDLTKLEDFAKVTTTDTAATTLWSYTMTDNTEIMLSAEVAANRTDGGSTNSAGYKLWGVFKRRGGGATQIGSTDSSGKEDVAVSITFDTSSNDVRIRVGVARGSETWVWRGDITVREVPTS